MMTRSIDNRTRMWRLPVARGAIVVGLALTVTSCGGTGDTVLDQKTQDTKSPLFADPGTMLWNGASAGNQAPVGSNVVIPVCFAVRPRLEIDGQTLNCPDQTSGDVDCDNRVMSPFSNSGNFNASTLRQRIRSVIEQSWVRAANIELVNWGDCPIDPGTNLHLDRQLAQSVVIELRQEFDVPQGQSCTIDDTCILLPFGTCETDPASSNFHHCYSRCVSDDDCRANTPHARCDLNPQSSSFRHCQAEGVDFVTVPVQGSTNMGMSTSAPTVVHYNWPAIQNGVDDRDIIHEFGHALGFSHEWTRDDFNDPACTSGISGGLLLTPFPDPDSVMNYCHQATPTHLSAGDVIGVQRAYGRKAQGSLVSWGGMCANISGGLADVGTAVIPYPCRNQSNDRWFRDGASQRLQANPSGAPRCLNISGGAVSSDGPTPLISWSCDDATNEQFRFMGVEWHGMGTMCATAVGGIVQMQPCDGSAAQLWNFLNADPNVDLRFDQIQSASTLDCVSAAGFGDVLSLRTCSPTDASQRFTYPGQGVIGFGNLCANVLGAATTAGSNVGLWNGCTDSPPAYNAQFSLSGNVQSQGQCIDSSNGSQLQMSPCTSSADQIWEYYL